MYLLVADYFSRFPEVIQLSTTTSSSVIQTMKVIFARHGMSRLILSYPEMVRRTNLGSLKWSGGQNQAARNSPPDNFRLLDLVPLCLFLSGVQG